MADNRDPASDQMKLWKEKRAAQVHPALSESGASASNGLGFPSLVPGAVPLIMGGGAAFRSRWSYIRREERRGFCDGGQRA